MSGYRYAQATSEESTELVTNRANVNPLHFNAGIDDYEVRTPFELQSSANLVSGFSHLQLSAPSSSFTAPVSLQHSQFTANTASFPNAHIGRHMSQNAEIAETRQAASPDQHLRGQALSVPLEMGVSGMDTMQAMGVSGSGTHDEAQSVASDRAQWRQLITQYSSRDRRTHKPMIEKNRLGTFNGRWPSTSPVQPRDLAKAGFYYIGVSDMVRCAFCQISLKSWEPEDVPFNEHRKHSPSCPFVLHQDVGNVPLQPNVPQQRPSETFPLEWRTMNTVCKSLTEDAATAMVHALLTSRVDYCSSILHHVSAASVQPLQNVLNAAVCKLKFDHIATGVQDRPHWLPVQQRIQYKMFQYRPDPACPEYTDVYARVRSFVDHPLPAGQTAEALANAGFFYIGPQDNVRCYWCGGSLKAWCPTDRPVSEHFRWFPGCKLSREQQLQLSTQSSLSADTRNTLESSQLHAPVTASSEGNIESVSISQPVDEVMETTESETEVGILHSSEEHPGEIPESKGMPYMKMLMMVDMESLKEENRRLKDSMLCKICMEKDISTLFLPCSHLVCCDDCAPSLRECPICRTAIRGTVRTYIS